MPPFSRILPRYALGFVSTLAGCLSGTVAVAQTPPQASTRPAAQPGVVAADKGNPKPAYKISTVPLPASGMWSLPPVRQDSLHDTLRAMTREQVACGRLSYDCAPSLEWNAEPFRNPFGSLMDPQSPLHFRIGGRRRLNDQMRYHFPHTARRGVHHERGTSLMLTIGHSFR